MLSLGCAHELVNRSSTHRICIVANIGVKDSTDDLVIVATDGPVAASGVFTQSRFVGPAYGEQRAHHQSSASAVVVISKNANVANGQQGEDDAREVVALTARHVGCEPDDVLIASTGVIGRPYPWRPAGFADISGQLAAQLGDIARGIMTTDTVEKMSSATIAGTSAVVSGVAKGVGMIEPDMATMIAMIFTDADISAEAAEHVHAHKAPSIAYRSMETHRRAIPRSSCRLGPLPTYLMTPSNRLSCRSAPTSLAKSRPTAKVQKP